MKRITGVLLSVLLIISLTVTSFAQVDINTNKNYVIIQGTTDSKNESVTIQINDGNKKVYFDQVEVEGNGKYKFQTKLDSNKKYKGYVFLGQEKENFEFKTSKAQEINEENKKTNEQIIKEALEEFKKYYKNKNEFTFREAIGYYSASDNKSSDISIIKSRFKEKQNLSLATDYANNIIGLIAGNVNLNKYKQGEYLTNLIKYQKPSGEFDLSHEYIECTQTAWSIIALDMANAKYNVDGAVKALIQSQTNGKFEDIDRTGMSLMALANHTDVEGASESIQKAEEFLLKNKKYIIEEANACTISAVIQGLISVGENPLSSKWSMDGKNMVNSLLSHYRKNKFKNKKETEQTFMALADLYNKRSMFTNKTISSEGYDKEQDIEDENSSDENNIEEPKDNTVCISIKGPNGYIVKKTKITIEDNDNALSILKKILKQNGIKYSIDSDGYVRSIDGLGEFDKGVKSGWMINIGGETISSGAGDFTDIFGKKIEWYYTKDYTVDSRNTNREIVEIIEDVDIAIANEEYKEAYSKIIDKNSDEEDILKATKQASDKLNKKVDSINSEKEAKDLVDDIEDISKIIKIAYIRINSQEGYDDLSQKAAKLTDDTVRLYKKISDKDEKEKVYKLLGKNIGITIKIIDKIEDQEKSEKICDDIIKSSLRIENKIPVYFGSIKNEVEVKLPSVFIKKLIENDISVMNISSDIASFSIIPNTFDKEKTMTLTAKKLKTSELSKKQGNRVPDDSIVIDFKLKDGKEDISEFKYPIEVTIPYEKSAKNKEKVNVFYIKDDGELESMGGFYNEKTKTVRFITNHFSKYFAKEYTKSFSDLENTRWAKDSVEIMASKGIVNGKEYDKFSPNDNITRAEFAALITRMLKYQESNDELSFKDVNKEDWYYHSINSAYQNKIINGKSEDTFDPNGNITRQEMAKIIAKVLESRGYKDCNIKELNIFKDKENIAPWAKESISLTVKEKIINGMEDKTFAPNEKATRAQAAVILHRLYKLIMK